MQRERAVIDHIRWIHWSWLERTSWRPKAAFPNPEISKIIRGLSSCPQTQTKTKLWFWLSSETRAGISTFSEQSLGHGSDSPKWESHSKPVRLIARPVFPVWAVPRNLLACWIVWPSAGLKINLLAQLKKFQAFSFRHCRIYCAAGPSLSTAVHLFKFAQKHAHRKTQRYTHT